MGLCGSLFRTSGYFLVAFIAFLAYFHFQCEKEKEIAVKKPMFDEFDPSKTDCDDVLLPFNPPGEKRRADFGIEFLLNQFAPCALLKFIKFTQEIIYGPPPHLNQHNVSVTFHDAREKSPGNFHKTGFTLIELENEPITKDWRTNLHQGNPDLKYFMDEVEPHIQKLYPDAKKIMWTHNVVRGGDKAGDQPKAAAPHLDYHQNKALRIEYHNRVGPPVPKWATNLTEASILMGEWDTEDNKFGVLLGIWKPLTPSKVCDWPLGVMDASTFNFDLDIPFENTINFILMTFYNLAGGIAHSPSQKWYYYPFQSTKEVLIFHQYSEGKKMANPHTSFFNKNCPKDTESRISVEMRVALFF